MVIFRVCEPHFELMKSMLSCLRACQPHFEPMVSVLSHKQLVQEILARTTLSRNISRATCLEQTFNIMAIMELVQYTCNTWSSLTDMCHSCFFLGHA